MYNVGMIGGKYMPLTQGHIESFIKAYTMCKKLYIIVCLSENLDDQDIRFIDRIKWVKNSVSDLENVVVKFVKSSEKSLDEYNWHEGKEKIMELIGEEIDVVFHSDPENRDLFKKLYPECDVITFDRTEVPISATMIRNNPLKYWDFIPSIVREHYCKKVCVVGTESCAKSTLVKLLAKHYNTEYVHEIGRDICEEVGGAEKLVDKDFIRIAIEHKTEILKKASTANKVLIVDTDHRVTQYYHELYCDDGEESTNKGISAFKVDYDLILFMEPDVEWVQDGTRTHGEDIQRKNNNDKLKNKYKSCNEKVVFIDGNYMDRYNTAKKYIDLLLSGE